MWQIYRSSSSLIGLFWLLGGIIQESLVDNVWVVNNGWFTPEIRWVVFNGLLNGSEGSLDEVSSGSGLSFSLGVDVLNTGELEEFFSDWWSNQTSTSWGWDKSDLDWTGFTSDFVWNGVDGTDLVTPISLSDWNKVKFGHSDGTLNGSLDFLVAFPSETDELLFITDNGESFKSGSLTGLGLFLDWFDFHDFFLQGLSGEESVNDFLFLDWDWESEDVNDVVDKFSLNESSELGDWFPFGFVFLSILAISWFSVSSFFVSGSTESSLLLSFWFGGLLISH